MTTTATETFFVYEKDRLLDLGRFPDADVVVLKEAVDLALHPDGQWVRTVRRAWAYRTEFGRDKFSDVSVPFRAGLQTLTIHRAETFMRDGKVMETPAYAQNEIVPFPLDHAPDFADARHSVVSLVGCEVGGVSVLETTVSDLKPWRDFFWGEEQLGSRFPVLEKTFRLKVPAGTRIDHAVRNGVAEPKTAAAEGFDVYVWSASDLPAYDPEDAPPGADRWIPAVVFSAAGSWGEVTERFRKRFEEAARPDALLSEAVANAIEDMDDPLEKLVKVHKHVLEGVRTLDHHAADRDYAFRHAGDVYASGYGTALEKGVLLAVAARAAGLKTRVFLGLPAYRRLEGVAYPGADAPVWVELGAGGPRFLCRPDKPLHEAGRHRLQETSLVPVSEKAEAPETPKVPRTPNVSKVEAELALKDGTLEGDVTCRFSGGFNPFFRLAAGKKTTLDAFAGECASRLFEGAEASEVRAGILSPDRTTLHFRLENAKTERTGTEFLSLTWPDLPKALHDYAVPVHRQTRCTTLVLPGSARVQLTLTVDLPKDARVRIAPGGLKRRGPACNVTVSHKEKEGSLAVDARWEFPETLVHPQDFGKFREAVCATANPEARSILIEGI